MKKLLTLALIAAGSVLPIAKPASANYFDSFNAVNAKYVPYELYITNDDHQGDELCVRTNIANNRNETQEYWSDVQRIDAQERVTNRKGSMHNGYNYRFAAKVWECDKGYSSSKGLGRIIFFEHYSGYDTNLILWSENGKIGFQLKNYKR